MRYIKIEQRDSCISTEKFASLALLGLDGATCFDKIMSLVSSLSSCGDVLAQSGYIEALAHFKDHFHLLFILPLRWHFTSSLSWHTHDAGC